MQKLLVIVGSVIALLGAVGLMLTGESLVQVFHVLTYDIKQDSTPAFLLQMRTVVASMTALTLGLGLVSLSTVWFSPVLEQSKVTRACFGASALAYLIGTAPLLLTMVNAISGFQQIASSVVAPTGNDLDGLIERLLPRYEMGFLIFAVATGLLLLGTLFLKSHQVAQSRRLTGITSAICSTIVVMLLPMLFAILRLDSHAAELNTMLANTDVTPKAAELASHLSALLFMPFLFVVGIAIQAMILMIISVSSSNISPTPDQQPEM